MPITLDLRKDFIVSLIRSQIETLKDMVATVELENSADDGFVDGYLKRMEEKLRQMRKMFDASKK